MSTSLVEIMELVNNNPYDLDKFHTLLINSTFTGEELMSIANSAVIAYDEEDYGHVYWRQDEEGESYRIAAKYDEKYVNEIKSHKLLQILRLILENGMNPNTCLKDWPHNVLEVLKYLEVPFLAGFCVKLLMEHGANPWMKLEDEEYLFEEIDADVCIDIDFQPDRMVQPLVQTWFVMVGYGARPKNSEPFHLAPNHSYEELKDFEFFEYSIIYDGEKKENIMHITDIRTGEEIGYLQ